MVWLPFHTIPADSVWDWFQTSLIRADAVPATAAIASADANFIFDCKYMAMKTKLLGRRNHVLTRKTRRNQGVW